MVKSRCTGFEEHFFWDLFIYGPKYTVRKKKVCVLMNVVFAVAVAIWISRKNKAKGSGCTEGEQVMKGLLAAHIRVEHAYY